MCPPITCFILLLLSGSTLDLVVALLAIAIFGFISPILTITRVFLIEFKCKMDLKRKHVM